MRRKNTIKILLLIYTIFLIVLGIILNISLIKENRVESADSCGGCPAGWSCYYSRNGVSPGSYFCLAPVGFSDFSSYPKCSLSSHGLPECDGIPLNPGQTTYCTTTQGNDFYVCSPGSATSCSYNGGAGCNCDMNLCENECRQVYANQPGTHIYKTRCSSCGQIFACSCDVGGNGGNPPPSNSSCPYSSTQVRVHQTSTDPWMEDLNLICGQQFIVGSFHDNTGQFANDTDIQVVGPNINITGAPNGAIFQTQAQGTYTIYVKTKIPGTNDYFSEPECAAKTTVICSLNEDKNPNFTITKIATNNFGPYDINDIVNFRVEIKNTGDVSFSQISYRDVFDNRFLQFISATGISPSNPNGINISNRFNFSNNGNIITFTLDDLTNVLGDLGASQSIYIDFSFRTLSASNSVCNDAFANPNGLSEKQARDCVGIIISTDL